MKAIAKGEFDVKLIPQQDEVVISLFGRMTIDKEFLGDLVARSQGQMLSSGTAISGSAGYVAIERVEGALEGKTGTFVLQHNATMNRGEGTLDIMVVPDSGTGELEGLSGKFAIIRKDKKHYYEFEYTLPEQV